MSKQTFIHTRVNGYCASIMRTVTPSGVVFTAFSPDGHGTERHGSTAGQALARFARTLPIDSLGFHSFLITSKVAV